jgi:hypothetical protein
VLATCAWDINVWVDLTACESRAFLIGFMRSSPQTPVEAEAAAVGLPAALTYLLYTFLILPMLFCIVLVQSTLD